MPQPLRKNASRDYDWILDTLKIINSNNSFQDTLNLLCSLEAETDFHFVLHCPYYENKHRILIARIHNIERSILTEANLIISKHFFMELSVLRKMSIKINIQKSIQISCLDLIHFEPNKYYDRLGHSLQMYIFLRCNYFTFILFWFILILFLWSKI